MLPQEREAISAVGAVVIGRNEGERLRQCLASLAAARIPIVYVDSGSADGSVELARAMGTEVVELDDSAPFCAARARNAGYRRLLEHAPGVRFVQFVDADSEIVGDWLANAAAALTRRADAAVVSGWLRERHPEASVFNRIGDIEWNSATAGETDSAGGICMIRREAFDSAGGFDASIPAGEEPELCQRLRKLGWKILRLDCDMGRHDLAMTRFAQWWRRTVRSGYGAMDVARRFGVGRFAVQTRRARSWAIWLLLTLGAAAGALAGSAAAGVVGLLLASALPVRAARIALRTMARGYSFGTSCVYAMLMAIAFVPQTIGQVLYVLDSRAGRAPRLVEYKGSLPTAAHRHPTGGRV